MENENEKEFVEREFNDFSKGFNGFGDLPDDLRSTAPIIVPNGSFNPPVEADSYSLNGGAQRGTLESISPGFANQITFRAVNYLPRANFESFRSQRFFAGGTALLPPDPTIFVDLLVNPALLLPTSPVKFTTGILQVPQGYAAVITGIRQWVGDATAIQKLDGMPDDISWRISVGGAPVFNFGNLPILISTLFEEGHLFVIVNESTTIQLSVKNNISPSDPSAHSIPIQALLTGHMFPIDELNDVFRNR